MGLLTPNQNGLSGLLSQSNKPVRRKAFISYHHDNDQDWYDYISSQYSDTFNLFYDNSLERKIDSTNSDYLNRKIREEYIFGTSVTIVLCGPETWKRRWIDWEVHATLHYNHGLLGVALPSCQKDNEGKYVVPTRLHKNIVSGFAHFIAWGNDPANFKASIETAVQNSSYKSLIDNNDVKMKRSSS